MANRDTPNGLKPVRYASGKPYDGAHNLYYVPATTHNAMFIGDACIEVGLIAATGTTFYGIPVDLMPQVNAFTASDALVRGVIVGFLPNPTALSTNHLPADTAGIVMVADDPDLIFEVQESATITGVTQVEAVGLNTDLVVGSGNATTGTSATEIDSSVTPVTTTLTVRLIRPVNRPDNAQGANMRWEVAFVEHSGLSATGIA